jgi:hypothetical protein
MPFYGLFALCAIQCEIQQFQVSGLLWQAAVVDAHFPARMHGRRAILPRKIVTSPRFCGEPYEPTLYFFVLRLCVPWWLEIFQCFGKVLANFSLGKVNDYALV